MATNDLWRARILTALGHMSDADYQNRSWNGTSPEVSSIQEVISEVYDDAMLIEFFNKEKSAETQNASELERRLSEAIDSLDLKAIGVMAPNEILKSEAWKRVQEIAALLLQAIKQ